MRQTQLDEIELIITLNKDRKQTKYGHKRQEHMAHTTEDWHKVTPYDFPIFTDSLEESDSLKLL